MSTLKTTGRIDSCPACGQSLPLRLPEAGRNGVEWICTGCGARFVAILDHSTFPKLARNVRPAEIQFDRSRLADPPSALAAFAADFGHKGHHRLVERRAFVRHVLVAPVAVVPIDEDYEPVGEAFMAVTRDVSSGGVSLIHTRAAETKLIVVELPATSDETIQVAVRVLRCRPVGLFYEIAGQFVVRLGE
jgi:hypothetical protein